MNKRSEKPAKLICRNVWKVYGTNPRAFFDQGSGDVKDTKGKIAEIRGTGSIAAAANVSFEVHEGEIFVIMGLSGSGKSTMVRCLSRLVEPTVGEVYLDGTDLLKASKSELIEIRRHKMGMVFQGFGLLPHLSVLENVAFPLKIQKIDEKERFARAREMIELVGLRGRENAIPNQLSGGQQQRVGIARSLAVRPDVWFLDEPFSALDPLIRRQMQDEFVRLQTMLHKTIVFITHDFLEALKIADRIAIMKDGEVVQIGTPTEIVLNPATRYVAEFTEDVPLVRVITCGSIMEPATLGLDTSRAVDPTTTLETLLPSFSDRQSPVAIVRDGAVVGMVTAIGALQALAQNEAKVLKQ
ncbi:quaternary amine ABC transporter ATP-binding protein [Mesorhizobium shangrilense]|uniref:Quaternary amine transport ATP-binding protein n=1 Tax=Mesorhizobium shangrilense TaxID=460060 RepID=A0ABV2DLT4_9HYPH